MKDKVILDREYTNQLRGFAMLIILFGHISGFFNQLNFAFIDNRYFTPLGGVGTAIFLFLSGYGLSESYKSKGLASFWKKKGLRLILPYVLSIPLFYIVSFFSPLMDENVLNSMPNQWYFEFMWFVEYLVVWYIIFWCAHKFFPEYALSLMVVIAIFTFFYLKSTLMTAQTFSFVFGTFISKYKDRLQVWLYRNMYCKIALIFFVLGICSLAVKQLPQIRQYELDSYVYRFCELLIYLPLGISIITLGSINRFRDYGILVFIGSISYELYLVHVPFLYGLNNSHINVIIFVIQCIFHAWLLNILCTNCSKLIDRFFITHY